MSNIILIGINHTTAPVELRENLAFSEEETLAALKHLSRDVQIKEAMVFSTCNRTEILYIPETDEYIDAIIDFISQHKGIAVNEFKPSLYVYKADEAVRHLFRVASSLDSMVVGEPQILGQIKQAYRTAVTKSSSGVLLNRLLHKSFSVAKKIRRQTGIGDNAVSISYAAIELANKIFSDLSTRSVMLLGAGEMAELAVEHLISNNVKQIIVANRTFENALKLADKFNGEAINFEEKETAIQDVDIIISSTGATDYVLTYKKVKAAMHQRNQDPLFFIDIAVPRDIDPDINKISNAYLYDIDDLKNVVENNIQQRENEIIKAERYIEEAVIKFRKWLEGLAIVPTIKAINEKISAIVEIEYKKTLPGLKHISREDADAIRRMTQAIASRTI
ncbi:MAG: glutamyl-tRNA reductase, partial [Desulfobacteraceae bacterium]|nr:glutamyl-tRNA reductase [Desulfobacteraceae bacterium]